MSNAKRNAEVLRRLREGDSFGIVAEAMGLSRNAVAGIAKRAGGLGERKPTSQRLSGARGEGHHNARLTAADVAHIRATYVRGRGPHRRGNAAELAALYGVRLTHLSRVASGRAWKHVV